MSISSVDLMRGLVKFSEGVGGLEIRDIPRPVPKGNELLVRVMAAGICGTDIHIMNDEYYHVPPVVLGHEYTGIVEGMGPEAGLFEKGDQIVSLTAGYTCGICRYCRQDLLMLCDGRKSIGSKSNGAMAEYMVIPENLAFHVPDCMEGSDVMAIAEPAACATRAVMEQSPLKAGDVALVSGPGAIGLIALMLAKIQGAHVVLAGLPEDKERLESGRDLGADAIATDPESLLEAVHSFSADGADVAFECSGTLPSFRSCAQALRKQGSLVQVGLFREEINVPMDKLLSKELKLSFSYSQERTSWEILLGLIEQGRLGGLARLISDRIPLSEWHKGFEMFAAKKGVKILLIP